MPCNNMKTSSIGWQVDFFLCYHYNKLMHEKVKNPSLICRRKSCDQRFYSDKLQDTLSSIEIHYISPMKTVHIEFIGDFICPWCYVGKVRLERVRERLKNEIRLDIKVKPYVLYPSIPKGGVSKSTFKKTKPGMGRALRQEAQVENIQFNSGF